MGYIAASVFALNPNSSTAAGSKAPLSSRCFGHVCPLGWGLRLTAWGV